MLAQPDADEDGDRIAHRLLIDERGIAGDDAALFEQTNPAQTGRRRQVHRRGQILIAQPAVVHQGADDLVILAIHGAVLGRIFQYSFC
jgi:hypothetical protein